MKLKIFLLILIFLVLAGFLGIKFSDKNEARTIVLIPELQEKNLSECNLLEDNNLKENCYLWVAKIDKNSSVCRLITDVKIRGDCYLLSKSN